VLHEQAPILDDVDPGVGDPSSECIIADSKLQPHGARALGEDVERVPFEVLRAAEYIDDVDLTRNVDQASKHRLAEDGGHFGVVDGNGDDFEPDRVEIPGHVERRLAGLRLGLHAKDGDALGGGEEAVDPLHVFDDARMLCEGRLAHAMERLVSRVQESLFFAIHRKIRKIEKDQG
jgi:hypothetical protein